MHMRKKRIMLHQYKVIKTKASFIYIYIYIYIYLYIYVYIYIYIYIYENYIVSVGLLENAHYNLRVRIGYKLQPV